MAQWFSFSCSAAIVEPLRAEMPDKAMSEKRGQTDSCQIFILSTFYFSARAAGAEITVSQGNPSSTSLRALSSMSMSMALGKIPEISQEMLKSFPASPRRSLRWSLLLFITLTFVLYQLLTRDSTRQWFPLSSPSLYHEDDQVTEEYEQPHRCFVGHPSSNSTDGNIYNCLGTRPLRIRPKQPFPALQSLPHPPLSQDCIDLHFATGELCRNPERPQHQLDVVWIWTNGSDPQFQNAIYDAQESTEGVVSSQVGQKKAKLYRDHDELRYSLRSVLQHFANNTKTFHVLSTDVGDSIGNRYGILPQWLNFMTSKDDATVWRDGNVDLVLSHHSQVFQDLKNSTFNSFSIETQLNGLASASEPFVYMNDDFFFAKDLSVTDFYSSVYGVVLRMDPGLLVAAEERPTDNPAGEWQPLKYSNWLLSERFGYRSRPYMIHVAKTLSPAILSEINSIWPAEFAETASHRFRGQRDVYTTFLHGHYLVERWRELLLWSWCVAKIGKDDDSWEEEDTWRAWEELGGTEYLDVLTVRLALRKTLEKERVERHLQDVGEQPPKATDYVFSSLDGFPYSYVYNRPKGFPNFASGDDDIEAAEAGLTEEWATCQIDRVKCFPAGKSASEIFKHILFTNPKTCGDCVITALINASGRLGLNAFLPPPHRIHYSNSKGRVVKDVDPNSVPRLPLSKRPRDASFKFKDVMRDWETVRVRDWVLRAMERYRFVIGNTPTHFAMLSSPRGAQLMFAKINSIKDLALLTVNDDVRLQEQKVDSLFRAFLDRRWGFPSAWENVVYSS